MNSQTLRRVRQFHHYIGVFLAPAIIFFAISGGLQTFRLQEAKGWGGPPPRVIVWMAAAHIDQAPPHEKVKKPEASMPVGATAAAPKPAVKKPVTLPLKIFVAFMAAGLVLSSLLGVVIAINSRTMRRVSILMLVAGTVVPLLLMPG